MRAGRILAVLLAVATATLSALAYASSPDPVWASGIFDDDDADNALGFIVSATALVEPLAFDVGCPMPAVMEYSVQQPAALPVCLVSSAMSVRAPPSDSPRA